MEKFFRASIAAVALNSGACVLSTTAKIIERTEHGGTIAYRNYADADEARAAIRGLMQCPDSYEFVSERPNHSWHVVTYRCVKMPSATAGGMTNEDGKATSSGQLRIVEGVENRCTQGDAGSCLQAGRFFLNRDEKAHGMRLLVLACAGDQAEACAMLCSDELEAARHKTLCATSCIGDDSSGCNRKLMQAQDQ